MVDIARLRRFEFVLHRRLRQQAHVVQHPRIAALCGDPALHLLKGLAGVNGFFRLLRGLFNGPAVAQVQHIGRQCNAHAGQVRAAMAAQDLNRLAHLERIADIEAERNIHVGHDCHDVPAAGLADAHHALCQFLSVFKRLHKRAGADLDIQHDGMRACGQLFGHDGRRDERQGIDCRGHVTQRVEFFIGGRQIAGLADDGYADVFDLLHEGLCRKRRLIPGDGFQLIDRTARMAEAAAGHLGHLAAETRDNRCNDQRRLIADAAGGMLVNGFIAEPAQIHCVARTHHRVRQDGGFVIGHTLVEHRHGKGGHLVIGDGAVGKALDDKADLVVGQNPAVPLFFNEINHSHENKILLSLMCLK